MFKNLKIKKKLIISFIICVALASIATIVTLVMLNRLSNRYDYALDNYGFAQGDIGEALGAFGQLDGNVHDAVSYFDKQHIQAAVSNVEKQSVEMNKLIATVEDTLTTQDDKDAYALVAEAWAKYEPLAKELVRVGSTTTDTVAIERLQARMVNELDPLHSAVYENLNKLMAHNVEYGDTLRADLDAQSRLAIIFGVSLVVGAILLSLVLGSIIANGIAKPMQACSARLSLLAKGDLSTAIPDIQTKDEVGELAGSTRVIVSGLTTVVQDAGYLLNEMAAGNFDVRTKHAEVYIGDFAPMLENMRRINKNLSEVLSQIRQSSDQVAAGSEQVSTGAQALAQGATEQASAVEELSATISDIANNARLNASTTEEAQQHANAAGVQVQNSNEQMAQMSTAMVEISKSSQEIGKIIATIENIAFQTNILALNAAVEAARAGTAGKGFAVVADEVRNLASKSDQAAKATKELIESSIRAVENGSHIVENVAESLRKTTDLAMLAVGDMGRVAVAVESEVASINQVTEGIEQISAVVQTNSATSEESAAASEELTSQAMLMRQLMLKFKLRKGEGGVYEQPTTPEPEPEQSYIARPERSYSGTSGSTNFSKY